MPPPPRSTPLLALIAWAAILPALNADDQPGCAALLDHRVLVLGDSITKGGTYVSMTLYALLRAFPSHRVDIVSIGLSSETTSGLTERIHPGPRPCVLSRLGRALDGVKPQLVIACYGMNDGIYLPLAPAREEAFHQGILTLVRQCQAAGAQVILLTPPVFDPIPHGDNLSQDDSGPGYTRPYARYDEVLAAYGAWEVGLHLEGLTVIDLHRAMGDYLAARRRTSPGFILSGDSIHPGDLGHLLMAQTLLRGMGMAVAGDDLDAELARMMADPLYQLAKQLRELRSGPWLAYSRGTSELGALTAVEQEAAVRMLAIDQLRRAGLPAAKCAGGPRRGLAGAPHGRLDSAGKGGVSSTRPHCVRPCQLASASWPMGHVLLRPPLPSNASPSTPVPLSAPWLQPAPLMPPVCRTCRRRSAAIG